MGGFILVHVSKPPCEALFSLALAREIIAQTSPSFFDLSF